MAKRYKKNTKNIIHFKYIFLSLFIIIILFIIYKPIREKFSNHIPTNSIITSNALTQNENINISNLEEIVQYNPDIVGWLEVPNTNINYAVVQGTDNDYYMNHNYLKEVSNDGSLFLDYRYNWNKPSSNLLIYGHNKNNNQMFNDLLKYKDEEFYKENPTFRFTTLNDDSDYEIISAFYSKVYYKSDKNVFRYYFFIDAENEIDFSNYVNNCIQARIYNTGKTATYGEQLITLSTCSYHTQDGRFAVVAKKKMEDN